MKFMENEIKADLSAHTIEKKEQENKEHVPTHRNNEKIIFQNFRF